MHRARHRNRLCPRSFSYRFDRPPREQCNPFTENCPISMRCYGYKNGIACQALPSGVHHRCREQSRDRSGGAEFIGICGCELGLWSTLCGPAIHLVGGRWRGYIFFGLNVRPDEFNLQACCPLVRTRQIHRPCTVLRGRDREWHSASRSYREQVTRLAFHSMIIAQEPQLI